MVVITLAEMWSRHLALPASMITFGGLAVFQSICRFRCDTSGNECVERQWAFLMDIFLSQSISHTLLPKIQA